MREDNYWSHFSNGTAEWQRAFNEPPLPRCEYPELWWNACRRWRRDDRALQWSCECDRLAPATKISQISPSRVCQPPSSSDLIIQLQPHLFFRACSIISLLLFWLQFLDHLWVSYVPSSSPLAPNFITPHYHPTLSVASITSSVSNVQICLNTKSTFFSLNLFKFLIKNASGTLLCSCTHPRTTVQDRNNFGWDPRHKIVNFTLGINLNCAPFYKLNSRQPHFPIIKSASKISAWPKNSDN